MPQGVQFEENDQYLAPIPAQKMEPPSFGDALLYIGIGRSPGDAALLLGLFAFFLVGVSFYIIASAVPPAPQLGQDVLRPGERIAPRTAR